MTPSDIKTVQRLGLITDQRAEACLLAYFDSWIRTLRAIRDLPEVSTSGEPASTRVDCGDTLAIRSRRTAQSHGDTYGY
jgi:hypothetical protein